MSSSLLNYASRVLSVDLEQSSFVPIVGLDKAADMRAFDSMMFAWRSCPKLQLAISEDDMEVQRSPPGPIPPFPLIYTPCRPSPPAPAFTS